MELSLLTWTVLNPGFHEPERSFWKWSLCSAVDFRCNVHKLSHPSNTTLRVVAALSRPRVSVLQSEQESVRVISWILAQTNGFFCDFPMKMISPVDARWKL